MPENPKLELPWVEKYRPQSASQLVGIRSVLQKILDFVKAKLANPQTEKKPILLEGPPGVGKTSCVYAIANDLKLSIIEMNASDARTADAIREHLIETSRSRDLLSFFGQKKNQGKIILVDEVDGISGQSDRGGLSELLKIIPQSKFPVIFTANEYDRKLQSLYKIVERVSVNRIRATSVKKVLNRVATQENIVVADEILEALAEKAGGDLRSAINDFQALVKTKKVLTLDVLDEITTDRDAYESIFNSIMELFGAETIREARAAVDASDVDIDMFMRWINENLPKHYNTFGELRFAYEHLAQADFYYTAIQMFQDWGLLPYVYDFLAGGTALARKTTPRPASFIKNQFPYNPRSGLSRADQEIVDKFKERLNLPEIRIVREILPRVKLLAKDKGEKDRIAKELDLSGTGKRGL